MTHPKAAPSVILWLRVWLRVRQKRAYWCQAPNNNFYEDRASPVCVCACVRSSRSLSVCRGDLRGCAGHPGNKAVLHKLELISSTDGTLAYCIICIISNLQWRVKKDTSHLQSRQESDQANQEILADSNYCLGFRV